VVLLAASLSSISFACLVFLSFKGENIFVIPGLLTLLLLLVLISSLIVVCFVLFFWQYWGGISRPLP
jgi:hypothetical protein